LTIYRMILTQCAVCATELGLSLGKKCGRCSTRYCGPECQVQHWQEGGHDKLCKKIKKAGGAEVYNANKKYAEAVTVAAEACADDTKGQTCFVCTQALHWKTKEGLVRGCACRGTAGFAHVSCLAEQAKILVAEAEENNLGDKVKNERWARWYNCSLCEQEYHGVVACALGWACWKTYVGRPERDGLRLLAMGVLGQGLSAASHYEDALSVMEAELSMMRRRGVSEHNMLITRGNLATTYQSLGRNEEALRPQRDVYFGLLKLHGEEHRETIREASNLASSLSDLKRFEEAKALLRKMIPVARRVYGDSHDLMLQMRANYAIALYDDDGATLDDLREAVTTLEEIERTARRVLGGEHPFTVEIEEDLEGSRAALRARESDGVSSVCEAVAAMTPGDA
jgi:tetratricopeptide (TPR) repeat protein